MAITFGTVVSTSGAWTTQSLAVDCTGADGLLVLESNANGAGGVTPTSMLYNSVSMGSPIYSYLLGVGQVSAYLITAPTTGSHNVDVTLSVAQGYCSLCCIPVIGLSQSTPSRTPSSNSANPGHNASITPTSNTDDVVVGNVSMYDNTVTSAGGQTNFFSLTVGGIVTLIGSQKAGGGGATLAWNGDGTGGNQFVAGAFALVPAGGGGGASVKVPMYYQRKVYINV